MLKQFKINKDIATTIVAVVILALGVYAIGLIANGVQGSEFIVQIVVGLLTFAGSLLGYFFAKGDSNGNS